MNGTMRLSRFQETAIYPKSQCKERIRRNFPKHFFYSHEVSFFLFSLLNLTSFVYLHHHHHRLLLLLLQEIKRRRKYPCSKMYFQLNTIRDMTIVNSTTPQRQITSVPSIDPKNAPNLDFLAETREAMDDFLRLCVPLHKLALEGNWPAANRIINEDRRLKYAALARGWPTVLHVAAGANHVHFVKELLQILDDHHIALQDMRGNTAFCFAAGSGNMDIVRLLLDRNRFFPKIRGGSGRTPVHFAALQGKCEMAWFLYDLTKDIFEDLDWKLLFFTCINTGNYGSYY
ncbi:hypothetical protein VNO77_23493 [Canavalia gladiata]|uniref:Uncharacterized protein n=1 Tax=Canavalia gladiata TaxID=3824 RepID=A0AAN9L7W7_CANGL